MPKAVVKRDGSVVPFIEARIVAAVDQALVATGREDHDLAEELGCLVTDHLTRVGASEQPG
ncbi:MAG: ATP cone domain-containing protein, partial [Planctomycetota bacterium]